jgi:hypothetical protein
MTTETDLTEAFYWCRRKLDGGGLGPVFLGCWVPGAGFAVQYSDFEARRFLSLSQVELVDGTAHGLDEAPLKRPEVE